MSAAHITSHDGNGFFAFDQNEFIFAKCEVVVFSHLNASDFNVLKSFVVHTF